MDDKVQKLLQRAIQENLSPDRVAYIMQFNGYDQTAIDTALSELSKKKRPVVFQKQYDSSDTQSQSQQVGPPKPSSSEEKDGPSIPQYDPVTFDQGTGGVPSSEEKDDVEVTTGDWWGNAWNGLVEGVSDFMYAFNKETGATQEQIAEFVELSKEKYPDLYRSYEQNKQSDTYKELGLTEEQIKRQAAANAYIEYWGTNPEIENEVVPYIRQRRRELAIEEDGVKIDQAVQEKLDEQFLAGAVKGLASSIPAMVTSGVTMGGSFMSTSYYSADENLKRIFAENPDLQMTRGQQEAYKLTVAGIEGVLEKVGLSGTLKGTSMAKRALTAKVFSRLAGMTDEIGSEAFERVVKEEVKGLKGYLKKTAQGTLSEAETGALQQLSNDLINETVNGLSGKEVFQPKDAMTILKDALYAGAQEAVGGGIISGTIGTFSNDIATQEDFDAAEEFIGKVDLVKMEQNLNKRVEQGQITEDKKANILEAAKGFKDTLAKVPEDMDQASKREVYQLINKKMQIQNKAAGKDSAIQKKANERVEQINEQIASIYESQVAAREQVAPATAPEQKIETPETTIEARFHTPEIQINQKGDAIIDPAKVKEETFTGASVIEKGHVDADTANAINRAVTMLGSKAKDMKIRVFDSVESLLNADQGAANFYAKSGKTPKAYVKGNEMFVLTKNAVEQYNAAKGTDVEYAKQYVHEIGHPIVSSLVAENPEVQSRLYNEIQAAAEAGDAVAQRALNFGKNYSVRGQSTVENETVVEFLALATDKKRFKSLPRSTKQKIIDFFNSILNSLGSEVIITTDQQLYDLARDMRDAYRMQKGIKVQPVTNKNYQKRSQEFSVDEGTTPGNRLFNAPLEDALTIAEKYAEQKGIDYDPGSNVRTLDTEMSQEIAQAYDRMEHDPQNPEVKKAYNAMVKETVEQYEAILEEGYVVEINNNEPYSSSKDMIEDLRTNKRMKIFSTESGFGAEAITDDQRAENPLLRDSGFTDVNGEKLLVNDVFRFVHDFFGHAKRGNGFGPKGEENAWDVHSRMYTSLARRAMTSETRGQNSWVNFSGVNDEAFKIRDKARKLRKEGRTDEAAKLIEQVYEMMAFAEQKIGLMPEQYTRNPYIEGGDPDFSLDESTVQVREGVDVRFRSINPAFVKKREMVHAERILSENKMFEFTGKRKIQSSADVAFLFRNMEDAASENAFAVFYTDEGDYKVIWLGTGTSTSVSVDFDGIMTAYENVAEDLGSRDLNLVFVHNHPSGQLIQSRADESFFEKIANRVVNTPIKLQDPIIINLDSGKYAVVNKNNYGYAALPAQQKKPSSTDSVVEVLSFGKQKLYESPAKRQKLGGTAAIATYLSKFKRGSNEKAGYFILNNQYQLMYSAILDPQASSENKMQEGIALDTRRYGNHVVLFGTDSEVLRKLKYGVKNQFRDFSRSGEFSVLDVIAIEPRESGAKFESLEYGDSVVKYRSQEIDFSLDETVVFHGGEAFSGPIDNNKPIFFSQNKRHAKSFVDATNEALSEQLATLNELKLDYTRIANEEYVADKMQELNILPTDPAHLEAYENMASEPGSWEGINLYEALDIESFALEEGETESYYPVISKEDRDLLSAEMRKDGFYGFSYLDFSPEGQAGTKFPDAVMVFNPAEAIQEGVLKGGFNLDLDQEFSVSDLINTDVESKGTPRLDDISFSLDEKVRRHEGRGKIVRSKLKDFVGKVMHVTFSDRMVGGFVGKEEYLGGVYFPYITNSLWGANSVGAANKIIKAAVKNADGFRYMVIGMMNPDSHMSNLDMSTKALKELESELNSSRVTVEEGYKRIMKAFDKKALKEKFGETVEKYKGKRQTKANLIKLIDETVLSTDATFDLRRSFLETVLGKADKNLKLRFGNLPSYSTLAQMLAEPVTRGMNAGDTSFIVRTKGDLSVAEPKKGDPDYHPSYRYIVRSTEDVELVFLDGIYNVVDMFPRIEAKNLGHKEYQDKYGDNWRMRYLMYMGLGKMSTTVSDEMVEAEAKAAIDFSVDEGANNIENLRGAIKRTLPRFAESRDRILANPEAYYTKQSLKSIKENLELMTEDELLENMTAEGLNRVANSGGPGKGENDISVLAAVELINRKAEAGEDVSELLVDLAKVGTTVGRMLRHFAELKSATPLGIVATIEGALAKANRIMSQSQVERLTDIAERFIKAQQKAKDLRDQIESEFSKETESELKKASKELDKVTRELNKFTSLIVPKKTMDLLSTTIQGNLLTPISQITNVGANLFQIMTSIPVKGFETLFSKITGKFTGGNKRSFTYSLLALPHAIKQGGVGVAEAIDTIIRGGASTEKIIHTGFLPGAAFLAAISDTKFAAMVNNTLGRDVIKGDVLARMANGKISAEDRLKALYEGMFGLAPEVMFRFLALGDKPFSRFAEGMEAYQQAYRLGLKGDALKNYVKYPSKKQQKAIEEAGKKLTFQQDSKIATGFFGATNWLQKQGAIGQAIAFSLKLTMPYVKTPANIFVETLKFAVPGIGVASAIRNFQKKNFDAGSKDLAMAATGQMLVMVANTLIANGLVSGAFDDEDEDERALKYLKFPPMSINKSGLIRLLKGENPEYRDGDIFIRYDKFGIPGMVIGARVTSIKNNLTEAQQQEEGYYVGKKDKGWFEPFSKVFDELGVGLGTVQFLNSQSFLTGANGLLKVLSGEASEYDVEKWMENTFRSLTAVPFPNTMSAVHRSIREYMPNLRTKSIETKFRYIVMDRLFESEGIPIKIDMLGRKIPQTPEGVKSWYYNLVDFTKEHPVENEPVLNEIYRLYSLQEDADVIPGFPTKLTRIPTKHPETGAKVTGWDPKKEEEYRQKMQKIQEVYAQNRAEILGDLFASDAYNGLSNEKKQERVIETLQKYDRGYVKLPKMRGMPSIKPPMEWKKMLDELNNQYFK